MQQPLRDYQHAAIAFALATPRCAIWADPGLGKTRIVLELIRVLRLTEELRLVLVIAPLRVARDVWPAETLNWTPELTCQYLPKKDACIIHTVNYERIDQWLQTRKDKPMYDLIVADEASRLKNFRLRQGGARAAALAQIAWSVPRLIQLTGTPACNGLLDLWGQLWFLDRGQRLGRSYTAYVRRWFTVGYNNWDVQPTSDAKAEIPTAIADLCLSINCTDWLALPNTLYHTIKVRLPPGARRQYRAMERTLIAEIDGIEHAAANAAVKTIKLLQLAGGAIITHQKDQVTGFQIVHSEKLNALADLAAEYAKPLLVAYWYKSDLIRLRKRFPEARTLDDNSTVEKTWNDGGISMLLIHPGSAGHGLNLQQGGRAICFFSDWWDLEKHLQVIERIGAARQAQLDRSEPVLVYQIVAENTIDELVVTRHKTKAEVQTLLRDYVTLKRKCETQANRADK